MYLFVQFVCTFGVASGNSIRIANELIDKCNISLRFFYMLHNVKNYKFKIALPPIS